MTLKPIPITLSIVVMVACTLEKVVKEREHQRKDCVQRISVRIRPKIRVTRFQELPSFYPILSNL